MRKQLRNMALLSLGMLGGAQAADLSGVKTYLLERLAVQKAGTSSLKNAAQRYYTRASALGFDYAKLAKDRAALEALKSARAGWKKASPVYESVEGIVAGVAMLSRFDTMLDAGTSKAEGGESVVDFDLKLKNGKTLEKPGNLFGVNEGSLWGSEKAFSSGVKVDLDGDGKLGFGDVLPDANVLEAAASMLDSGTTDLIGEARKWTPSSADVFTALSANVPTVAPVFLDRWKSSRFILGDKATRRDFNVISSLEDLQGNISSWQAMYRGLSPSVKGKDSALDAQIAGGLEGLLNWSAKLTTQEKARRFRPEQAELIVQEGQNRATLVSGKIAQAAAQLGVKL